MLLMLLACFPRVDLHEDVGGAVDTGAPLIAELHLDGLDPVQGSDAGGQTVTIQGGPFEAAARAWFGEAEATVRSFESDVLVVTTPESPMDGLVDVRVQAGGGEDTLEQRYRFWPDASGRAVLVLGLWYTRWLSPDYGMGFSGTDRVDGSAWFIEPSDLEYRQLLAQGVDSCASPSAGATAVAGPSSIDVATGNRVFRFYPAGDGYEVAMDATDSTLPAGASGDISTDEDAAYPALEVAEAFRSPDALDLLVPDLSNAVIPAQLKRSDFTLTWSSSGATYVFIRIVDLNNDAAVVCVAQDDGSFQVPASALEALDYGDFGTLATVQLELVGMRSSSSVLPFDNGELRVDGGYGVAGAAMILNDWWSVAPAALP